MARDSQDTKRRIFEAATAEFTAHGIAGARVDRIAAAANANKQLIYAYFGSKRKLFEAVVAEHVTRLMEAVPFDAADLPAWAGDIFDFFVAHPEIPQLSAWHSLEPGESEHRIPIIEDAIALRTRQIRRAQAAGFVDPSLGPAELFALVNAIVRTWAVAPPERNPRRGPDARVLKRRRAAVMEATRRLAVPDDR
ncbi:MAG TPA: TetR family transcriptional regulator [Gaiellaceae bacterium]|jgi:AcrR family transcriptional regulator|nr:TetR family transcriptional regulator [Gaiellaceae bacterium]